MNPAIKFVGIIIILSLFVYSAANEIEIRTFIKTGKLTEGFTEGEENYFWHIDDMCCDDENNLYVSDAGWNKIFKFNALGEFVLSFGGRGHGPGELYAQPKRGRLGISFGNDGNLYVSDQGNNRLSVFDKKGIFQNSFSLPAYYRDQAQVNSDGDIYLISESGDNIIHCYDKNYQLKHSFLNVAKHFKYPIMKPRFQPFPFSTEERPLPISERDFPKVIMKNDHLVALSNISLTVFHFDKKNELMNEFMIENDIFLEDFKQRLKTTVDRGGFIDPFRIFLDGHENLCLMYYNNSVPNKWEVYRYKVDGTLIDLIRLPETVKSIVCVDGGGNFYFVSKDGMEIGVFQIEQGGFS
jgi:sugar lactone lactonase YvrE